MDSILSGVTGISVVAAGMEPRCADQLAECAVEQAIGDGKVMLGVFDQAARRSRESKLPSEGG